MTAPKPCSVPECDRTAEARGYCRMHYDRFMRHGDPTINKAPRFWHPVERTCGHCGRSFPWRNGYKYCSLECGAKAKSEKHRKLWDDPIWAATICAKRHKPRLPPLVKECKVCGTHFTVSRRQGRYRRCCSPACAKIASKTLTPRGRAARDAATKAANRRRWTGTNRVESTRKLSEALRRFHDAKQATAIAAQPITDQQFLAAWGTGASPAVIAKQYGVAVEEVQKIRRRLRKAGAITPRKNNSRIVEGRIQQTGPRTHNLVCRNCGVGFVVISNRTRTTKLREYCSPECAQVGRSAKVWTPEQRQRQSEKGKARWHDPEYVARMETRDAAQRKPPRVHVCQRCGVPFTGPGKGRHLIRYCPPCLPLQRSETTKARNHHRWQSAEERAKISARNRERWATDPAYVERITKAAGEAVRRAWRDPLYRMVQAERCGNLFRTINNKPENRKKASQRMRQTFMLARTGEELLKRRGIEIQPEDLYPKIGLWFWNVNLGGPTMQLRKLHFLAKVARGLTERHEVNL